MANNGNIGMMESWNNGSTSYRDWPIFHSSIIRLLLYALYAIEEAMKQKLSE
jgi:hypothetical protein